MDILASYQRKAQFLSQDALRPLIKKLHKAMQSLLLKETDPRAVSPFLIRSACFELSYILLRHRLWHHASLLSELAIDFVNSEFHIPASLGTELVESALDILHSYTPREADWQEEDYTQEFLEHMLICTLLSETEDSLSIDLGFGKNVLNLLKASLSLDADAGTPDVFAFAPELTGKLHGIMTRLVSELDGEPWTMDTYRLKNLLQRDPFTPRRALDRSRLESLLNLIGACWPHGCTAEALARLENQEHLESDLRLLLRNGLLYEEPQRKPKGPLLKMSAKAYEMTSLRFAFTQWDRLGSDLHLDALPSVYQASLLQVFAQKAQDRLESILAQEARFLTPAALRFVALHMKRNQDEKSLLDIFEKLLHNQPHAWLRAEICKALPLKSGLSLAAELLEGLVNEDPSPMVRAAARSALQRQPRGGSTAADADSP